MMSWEKGKVRNGVVSRTSPRVWPVIVIADRWRSGRKTWRRASMPPALWKSVM